MNLRRELRTKFEDVLQAYGLAVPEREPLADLLADAALSVSGIAKQERKTDETQADYITAANRKMDALLDMANFPGAKAEARRNSILSYLGETFHKNVETKEWREFAKYIDSEHQSKGWDVKQFIEWMYGQKNFDLQYWPVKKMRENYPAAFAEIKSEIPQYKPLPEDNNHYVPNPNRRTG
jgi:hypothetical protein